MKNRLFFRQLLFSVILICVFMNSGMAQVSNDVVIGNTISINSKILNEERNVQVYLPVTYNAGKGAYPVLYLLDGETHFIYTAGLVRFLSNNGLMPETIVIGIPNTKRNRDYTVVPTEGVPESGGADNFLEFLQDELIPKIDREYRTQKYRILAGHSLCGMFSVYTILKKPELFEAYIGLSPWVIASNNYIMGIVKNDLSKFTSLNKRFYFTAGSLEGKNLLATLDEFVNILKEMAPKDFTWKYKLMEDEDHGSLVLMTLYDGLKFIYKNWRLPDSDVNSGLEAILAHYKKISAEYGYEIKPPEVTMNLAGYGFLQNKNHEEAIKIFRKNIELYPASANVYDSCGEALEKINQLEEAKGLYAKAYDQAKENNDPNINIFKTNFERVQKALNTK